MLNIAHACVTEAVNGPGRRFTVWVQGCSLACPGCFNPELRAREARRLLSAAELAQEALEALPWEGVTLSGGEPFDQAADLAAFLEGLGSARDPFPVIAFSGHALEELWDGPAPRRELLARIDLLVEGPYLAERSAALPLRGSANQRLVALTPRGLAQRARVAAEARRSGVSVVVGADGTVVLSGFPPEALVERLGRRLEP
ncbi:MAG: 4Fe-4S single cluster domain-containing protein [Thermodesulfobacteriota bacterium]